MIDSHLRRREGSRTLGHLLRSNPRRPGPRRVTRPRTVGFGKAYPEFWINLREGLPPVAPKSGLHICLAGEDDRRGRCVSRRSAVRRRRIRRRRAPARTTACATTRPLSSIPTATASKRRRFRLNNLRASARCPARAAFPPRRSGPPPISASAEHPRPGRP